jgi:hypothetical protein
VGGDRQAQHLLAKEASAEANGTAGVKRDRLTGSVQRFSSSPCCKTVATVFVFLKVDASKLARVLAQNRNRQRARGQSDRFVATGCIHSETDNDRQD